MINTHHQRDVSVAKTFTSHQNPENINTGHVVAVIHTPHHQIIRPVIENKVIAIRENTGMDIMQVRAEIELRNIRASTTSMMWRIVDNVGLLFRH